MTIDESEREKKNQRPLDKKQKIEDGTITSTATTIDGAAYKKSLYAARDDVDKLLIEKACGPIMVRLAWHDSGTYDIGLKDEAWPNAGGANASIRFKDENSHGANAGLINAIKLLETIKEQHPLVSYADLYQMASARAIEYTGGGPNLEIRYGRQDAPTSFGAEGNLPDGEARSNTNKFGGTSGTTSTEATTAGRHLRKVFYRMGLNDEAIVALSGAHTLGRAYKDRSGQGQEETSVTNGSMTQKFANGTPASFHTGGSSWTENFFIFDNSYYTEVAHAVTEGDTKSSEELLKLSSDKAIFKDDQFRPYAMIFRNDLTAFYDSYKKAHKQLSELGAKFVVHDTDDAPLVLEGKNAFGQRRGSAVIKKSINMANELEK